MEVMLDLETLSTRGHATILVIAGIKFNRSDPHIKLEKMDKFYAKISTDSCKAVDMHIDPNTVKWWNSQDQQLRQEIFSEPRDDLKITLQRFKEWYGNSANIWSHGATFDIPILAEAYARHGLEPPWKFWTARDTRTLFDLTRITNKDLPSENLHNPIYDCWRQIYGVKEGIKKLKK